MLTPDQLRKRGLLLRAIRLFFDTHGFIEVETPCLLPVSIPEANIEPLTTGSFYFQSSPELCMKRLLAAGCQNIFQICKSFRRNERGDRHLPEFTMLEWYSASCGYHELMDQCEDLLLFLADQLTKTTRLTYGGRLVSLQKPWDRLTVSEAFARYAPVSLKNALAENMFDEILTGHIEQKLGWERPAFLYDYPAELAALARLKPEDPSYAERVELYVAGLEIANGFSELSSPEQQRRRFENEHQKIAALGRVAPPMPDKFLDAIELMPEAAGIALGVDRLAMIFFNAATIDQVVSFTPEDH